MAVARRIRRRGWMTAANKANQTVEPKRPVVRHLAVRSRAGGSLAEAKAYVFVVEGAVIDTVLPSTNCWLQTLTEFGHTFRTADVHRYHGLDPDAQLDALLPSPDEPETKAFILAKYRMRWTGEVMPTLRPFPGVRELILDLASRGAAVALVTHARGDELTRTRALLGFDETVAIVSGDDVARGMPHADRIGAALGRLAVRHPGDALVIGASPWDAEAAHAAHTRSVGMLTGLFARADLLEAGCQSVFLDAKSLAGALATPEIAA
ncbi:HAD family hydrolase [Rhodoplanes azumiensis]|uniref:HAD family hydrolase n=1 Tax=Rhodoplanes azumiensis TaxID=1897628 RepID=A0ABW5AKF3_9BRAD